MKTYTAPFAQTTQTAQVVLTAASVIGTADAPTNTALSVTAGAEGALLTSLTFTPRATMLASVAYLFASKDNGTTQRLIGAVNLAGQTVSATVAPTSVSLGFSETTPRRLQANEKLYVGMGGALAAGMVVDAQWTDF